VALVEPVDVGGRAVLERTLEQVADPLESIETALDAAPAQGDQVDEDGEIVDARSPLGVEVELEALEPADRLARETAHLRDVAPDRENLGAHARFDGRTEALRNGGLELRRPLGERLERFARPVDGGVERGRVRTVRGRLGEATPRALERLAFHAGDASVGAGRC
jgi:hypothetical protein